HWCGEEFVVPIPLPLTTREQTEACPHCDCENVTHLEIDPSGSCGHGPNSATRGPTKRFAFGRTGSRRLIALAVNTMALSKRSAKMRHSSRSSTGATF